MTELTIVSAILEFIGTILVAFTALRVHHRFLMEHQIDDKVFSTMKREQLVGLIGIAFLSTGFLLHLINIIIS